MIRTPSGKNLMNEHEAIQWLLDNNALPFQCTADYVGGAEIGLGTIVNPTPAKVRVGSLIFFADSKVSTVIAITSNSFICSDEYNDLVDDVVYVSNVQLNASGHLIVTLSNGTDIDAGLIKQITNFSINGSQHLIANYNDGTSTDLGAIFSGNITISGNLTVSGTVSASNVAADELMENMSGYSFTKSTSSANTTLSYIYAGVVKTGNKITFVLALDVTKINAESLVIGSFTVPSAIFNKLYPIQVGLYEYLALGDLAVVDDSLNAGKIRYYVYKASGNVVKISCNTADLTSTQTYVRLEVTFLLSDNLAA